MKRSAIIIKKSKDGTRCIAVDEENFDILNSFFQKDKRYIKKFKFICELLLQNHKNRELYDKEEPDSLSIGVRAMKFFKGQENARVYCREVTRENKTFVIVAVELLERKKQTKLTHKELNIIHRVADYEYTEFKYYEDL